MDSTFTYSRDSEGPLLFTLAGFLASAKQGILDSGFDDGLPHLDNAVDYAEQL
jgi:hypothetical protein